MAEDGQGLLQRLGTIRSFRTVRQPYSIAEPQLLQQLRDAGWKPNSATCSETELREAVRIMEDLHWQVIERGKGQCPPLRGNMQAGLEARLLSLLKLEDPACHLLQPHTRAAEVSPSGPVAPFYFFAPKLEGPVLAVQGTCQELGAASFDQPRGQSHPRALFEPVSEFLVGRVLMTPPKHSGKWFEYKPCAVWGGRFVADARPPIAVDAIVRHQIIDPFGIPLFNIDYQSAPEWMLQLCPGLVFVWHILS
ncbi:hypothetical protein AK812_SmicGene103 [Symbiodinium microadriaticum]|uniref:Uncharacterized protein n=1 Tax=Symbiodinium microadriaticum TaxID=2951 RepID=A0A1Q9F7P9_SYMMI|nr:hypothetical protein AK812_SmicGene103 [Symbiodinium microadriaticum]